MGECSWLDKKHTIFGKVEGATLFNAIKISEVETDGDKPVCDLIPKIISCEVKLNPFDDIVPRNLPKKVDIAPVEKKPFFQNLKNVQKNKNLLSFADDDEDEEPVAKKSFKRKIKSTHEAL